MLRTNTVLTGLVALTLTGSAAMAQTSDTFRLDLRGPTPAVTTLTPGLDADGDTELVRGWCGRHYGGFGYGSFYRSYAFYPRYYAPSYSFAYARPFAYGYGFSSYRPFAYSSYYYSPSVYYSPYYYCPISEPAPTMPYATSTSASLTVLRPEGNPLPQPIPFPKREVPYASSPAPAATYPYDGGPSNPVPLPGGGKKAVPQPTVPLEGKAVSLPRSEPKYTYPAYGERPAFAQDRVVPISTPTSR